MTTFQLFLDSLPTNLRRFRVMHRFAPPISYLRQKLVSYTGLAFYCKLWTLVIPTLQTLPHQFSYLSSLIPYCIQNDVTSQLFSLSFRFKKPRPILLWPLLHDIQESSNFFWRVTLFMNGSFALFTTLLVCLLILEPWAHHSSSICN